MGTGLFLLCLGVNQVSQRNIYSQREFLWHSRGISTIKRNTNYTKGSRIKRLKKNIHKEHNEGLQRDKGRYWKHVAKTGRYKRQDYLKILDTITKHAVLEKSTKFVKYKHRYKQRLNQYSGNSLKDLCQDVSGRDKEIKRIRKY